MRDWHRKLAAGSLLLLFVWCCTRAATQSFTHDEALTFQFYLATPAATMFEFYDANHHFLFTLLMRLSAALFGYSELALRLPTLLAAGLYFVTIYRLSVLVFGGSWLFLPSIALAAANPLVLDFMVAARGYGLALALFTYAIYRMILFLSAKKETRSSLYQSAVGLSLAVTANLIFLFPAIAAAGIFVGIMLSAQPEPARGKKRKAPVGPTPGSQIVHFAAPILAVAFIFFLAAPLSKARSEHFYTGADTVAASLLSLARCSFPESIIWLGIFVPPLILAAAWIALRKFVRKPASPVQWLALFSSATLLASALLLLGAHLIFGFPYPADRTGLYFLPLSGWAVISLAAMWQNSGRAWRIAGWSIALFAAAIAVIYCAQLNRNYFYVWRYDADTRALLGQVQVRAGAGPVQMGGSWVFEPVCNFYRLTRRWTWMAPVVRGNADDDAGYYLLTEGDAGVVKTRGLHVLGRGKTSGAVLASR